MSQSSTGPSLQAPASCTASSRHASRWSALAVVVAAQFMFVVDAFIVNVALPSIRADLAASAGDIQGVLALYQIAFAVLVVAGGRLGDVHGSKIIFLMGLAGFTIASLWCGFARSGPELVLARAGQGAAAALMIPQVLATIHQLFTDTERGKAFGIYGFTLGFGAAVGFGLGGWLLAANLGGVGWRTIFFVNGPLGIALVISALAILPVSPRKEGVRLDLLGAAVLLAALMCLIGPLLIGADLGWPAWLALSAALGIALLALFGWSQAWVEMRGGLPLVHLDLLGDRRFAMGLLTAFLLTFANISFYLLITLYMQNQLGFTPLQSGAAVIPLAVVFALVSRASGPRAQRLGALALIQGCCVAITGLVALVIIVGSIAAPPMPALASVLVIFGAGQAMVMAPLYAQVLSEVPPAHAGSAAGVLSTVLQIGNASGVAVIGATYFGLAASHEVRITVIVCLVLLIAAFSLLALLLRGHKPSAL
jgi:EmrB/QacA subfamily drug resistance transporter